MNSLLHSKLFEVSIVQCGRLRAVPSLSIRVRDLPAVRLESKFTDRVGSLASEEVNGRRRNPVLYPQSMSMPLPSAGCDTPLTLFKRL